MQFTKIAAGAVVAGILAFSGHSQAVTERADGQGQVLLFPYYTTQGGMDTYLSIINNNMTWGKALKVRLLEGKNSREVLSFNLYLGARDTWSGAVTVDASGNPILRSGDTSCTVPAFSNSATAPGTREIALSNARYSNFDKAGSGLDRARKGHVEVVEMGVVKDKFIDVLGPRILGSVHFSDAIAHVADTGVPLDCGAVASAWETGGFFLTSNSRELVAPSGGLTGSGQLINVAQGTDYSYDPVALDAVFTVARHTAPGDAVPSLDDAWPISAVIPAGSNSLTIRSWPRGADAVSEVLRRAAIINEFATNPGIAAQTDWVVTFPTWRFHVVRESDAPAFTGPPFVSRFDDLDAQGQPLADGASTGACANVWLEAAGREQQSIPAIAVELCWASSVLTFNGSHVLASANVTSDVTTPFADGWLRINLGLPAIGFAVQKYVNGNVGGVLSNYGVLLTHKYH